jgi:hypothetical protein
VCELPGGVFEIIEKIYGKDIAYFPLPLGERIKVRGMIQSLLVTDASSVTSTVLFFVTDEGVRDEQGKLNFEQVGLRSRQRRESYPTHMILNIFCRAPYGSPTYSLSKSTMIPEEEIADEEFSVE